LLKDVTDGHYPDDCTYLKFRWSTWATPRCTDIFWNDNWLIASFLRNKPSRHSNTEVSKHLSQYKSTPKFQKAKRVNMRVLDWVIVQKKFNG